jgi:hypothetical protein
MISSKSIRKKLDKKQTKLDLLVAEDNNPADKIFQALNRNNNSFFEDDPNYLYEYLSRVNNKVNDPIKPEPDNIKKKTFKLGHNTGNEIENLGFKYDDKDFKIPNSEDSLLDYKDNLANYMMLKHKLKNDQFLIRKESDRENKDKFGGNRKINDQEEEKQFLKMRRLNKDKAMYGFQEEDKHNEKAKVDKFIELNKQMLEKEALKRKNVELKGGAGNIKMMQTYSAQEIDDYYNYKKRIQNNIKNFDDKKLEEEKKIQSLQEKFKQVEKVRNKSAALNNNVILFKPSVFKSKKQQHYEMAFSEFVGNNQINVLMKNKTNFKDLEENEVKFKLENFERKIMEIENKNYIQKLEKLEALNAQIHQNYNKDMKNKNTSKRVGEGQHILDDSIHEMPAMKRKDKQTSFCEKVMNFFIGDPYTSYAHKKHLWCGNDRPYGKYFEDTRVFGDDYNNQIAGEDDKLKKVAMKPT